MAQCTLNVMVPRTAPPLGTQDRRGDSSDVAKRMTLVDGCNTSGSDELFLSKCIATAIRSFLLDTATIWRQKLS